MTRKNLKIYKRWRNLWALALRGCMLHGDEIWRSVQRAIRIVNHQIPDTLSLNHTLTIKSGPGPLAPGHHIIVCLLL